MARGAAGPKSRDWKKRWPSAVRSRANFLSAGDESLNQSMPLERGEAVRNLGRLVDGEDRMLFREMGCMQDGGWFEV